MSDAERIKYLEGLLDVQIEFLYEISNQLGGYVDVSTPEREFQFIIKVANWVAEEGDSLYGSLQTR
jgi:hypothetical protein